MFPGPTVKLGEVRGCTTRACGRGKEPAGDPAGDRDTAGRAPAQRCLDRTGRREGRRQQGDRVPPVRQPYRLDGRTDEGTGGGPPGSGDPRGAPAWSRRSCRGAIACVPFRRGGSRRAQQGSAGRPGGAVTPPRDGGDRPVYRFWHGHVSTLLAEARPDLEAEVVADLLLACLHAEPTLRMLERGEGERVAFALRALAVGLVGE